MDAHPFYAYSAWLVFLVGALVLLAAALIGFQIGRLTNQRVSDKDQIGSVQASVLGLLALLLGFTFGVAFSRYDSRRLLAVDEANALGTTFLRAQMMPQPYKTNLSNLLRRYIDVRLQMLRVGHNPSKLTRVRHDTLKMQQAIWRQAQGAARAKPDDITGTFVTSLNQSIDLYSSRAAEFYARVPATILWILSLISVASLAIVGYGFGLSGQRSWMIIGLVAVLVSGVIVMIVDLDQPQSGRTRVSQQTMIDLRDSLAGFEDAGRSNHK